MKINLTLQVIILYLLMCVSLNAGEYKNFCKNKLSYNSNHPYYYLTSKSPILDCSPYQLDHNREILLLGSGGVLGITGLALINNITPLTLEEISQLDPSDVNSFDRHAVGTYRDYLAGDLLLYGSFFLPLMFLSNKDMKRDWKILGIIGLEVMIIQGSLNLVVKGLTQRIRPYVYDPNSPPDKKTSKDAKLSFYSGHTSTTAAMCFYTAKVFSDYLPDGITKTFIWTGAVIYPSVAGYLRVASANHFATDVIVGYAVGAMIGYFIPLLHKVSYKDGLSFFPSLKFNHLALSAVYTF